MLDNQYMQLAIELAKITEGQTTPNPSVGAVLVKNGQVVGLGSHLFAGLEHAEVHAINMAGEMACGATLYVTLEPCVHHGRTPPCTDSIIKSGIKRVVVATLDLNPQVAGKGIQALLDAQITVEVGLLEDQAKQINQMFFQYIQHKMPYITLKAGVSLDSKLATSTGESKWITNEKSREDTHYLRHTHDAILVGIGTVLADNPSLTTRLPHGGKNPIRIILDTNLRTPLDAQVIVDGQSPTWIIVGNQVSQTQMAKILTYPMVKIIQMPEETINLQQLMLKLASNAVTSILVEGGNQVISGFLEAKLINQLVLYISPMLIGGADAPTFFAGSGFSQLTQSLKLEFETVEPMADNFKIVAKVKPATN